MKSKIFIGVGIILVIVGSLLIFLGGKDKEYTGGVEVDWDVEPDDCKYLHKSLISELELIKEEDMTQDIQGDIILGKETYNIAGLCYSAYVDYAGDIESFKRSESLVKTVFNDCYNYLYTVNGKDFQFAISDEYIYIYAAE